MMLEILNIVFSSLWVLALIGLAIATGLLISFLLACAGEPQSQWIWCTVLGAC